MVGKTVDLFDALSLPVLRSDRVPVARGTKTYKAPPQYTPLVRIPIVTPASADFPTWANQNSASVTDLDDAFRLSHAGIATAANSVSMRLRSLPAGSTWTITVGFVIGFPAAKQFMQAGLVLRESATSKLETVQTSANSPASLQGTWTNETTFSNVRVFGNGYSPVVWYRAVRSGTALTYYTSHDGLQWTQFGPAVTVTTHFTTAPDQWGVFVDFTNNSVSPTQGGNIDVFHWSETNP